MKTTQCLEYLAENKQRIRQMVDRVSLEQARWRPDPESWSILEVINHLLDEEKLDFRLRLDITLHRPAERWPAIDPSLWVTERRYNERDLSASLSQFVAAREDSLSWLSALQSPDWDLIYEAPWGKMRAGDLMASWVAHDLLHMRQLVELHWAHMACIVAPYQTQYAVNW